jgi:hypothetical protein
MSIRDEIIRIFKRNVIAYPDGAVVHMGDCNIYSAELGVCSCGLHHWLMIAPSEVIEELYPDFMEEETNEAFFAQIIRDFEEGNLYTKEDGEFVKVEKPEPISVEEVNRIMKEIFKKEDESKE